MAYIDPHMHIWDPENGIHNAIKQLGAKEYSIASYSEDLAGRIKEAVFVEAIPTDPVAETKWVAERALQGTIPITGIVAHIPLHDEHVEDLIKGHLEASTLVKGGRLILYDVDSPPEKQLTALLTNSENFKNGYRLLEKYNLSWDMQIDPTTLKTAAKFLADFPKVPTVFDHVGFVKLSGHAELTAEDVSAIESWKEGLTAVAALPNTFMKLSMLNYTLPNWFADEKKQGIVKNLVLEIIKIFGSSRCMFASNFPVDKVATEPNGTGQKLYDFFESFVSSLSEEDRSNLFINTAKKFYKL